VARSFVLLLTAGALAVAAGPSRDGSGVGSADSPEWSPGADIVFSTGTTSGPTGVFAIHPDGSGLRRLARRGDDPKWSPSRDLVAFTDNGALYVVRPDGTGLKRVHHDGFLADWSPDGSHLLYATLDGGVWMSRRDGTGSVHLTTTHLEAFDLAWSPDSRSIAFIDCRTPGSFACGHGSTWDVYVLKLAGPNRRRRVTSTPLAGGCLAWAPGRQIAFQGDRGIYVSSARRRGQRLAIRGAECPSWSPDGRQLAASLQRSIVVAQVDGRHRHAAARLRKRSFLIGAAPAWSPDGRHIAFIWPTGTVAHPVFRLFTALARGGGLRRLT